MTAEQFIGLGKHSARTRAENLNLIFRLVSIDGESLLVALRGKVADWWLPDQVHPVATMPMAATGKIDKTRLRADYGSANA